MDHDLEQLDSIVRRAAGRAEVREVVGALYSDVQRAIDARRPICSVSGRCCRFEEFGHRLFVTTLELAAFVHDLANRRTSAGAAAPDDAPPNDAPRRPVPPSTSLPIALDAAAPNGTGGGCPFQVNGLCGVHVFRPFGCRMFFCDATATDWQNEAYEQFHARLKRLHESLGVPYFYLEWRSALRALGLVAALDRSSG